MPGRHRPCDQGEAQKRDRRDVEQHPHPGHRDRLVDDEPCRRHRDDDQDDGADALGPRRPAEQQPPDDDGESAQGSTEDPEHGRSAARTLRHQGRLSGTTNASSHCRVTMTTPGHSRSGLRDGRLRWCVWPFGVYSEPSACRTSTRDARAAGINDAMRAATTRQLAAPRSGNAPGSAHVLESDCGHTAEDVATRHACDNPDRRDDRRPPTARRPAGDAASSRSPAALRIRACARSPRTPARRPPRRPRSAVRPRRTPRARGRSAARAPTFLPRTSSSVAARSTGWFAESSRMIRVIAGTSA